jgi:hypothetical protein
VGQTDWTLLTGVLSSGNVARGVTHGIPRPASTVQNDFIYGFNSQTGQPGGVAGWIVSAGAYNPTAANKGGRITACVQKGASAGNTGFAPMLFIGLQNADLANPACKGYVLGLADADPPHLVLKKGLLNAQLQDVAPVPASNGILARSTNTYNLGVWYHLRLDMVVNINGDVILTVYENNLAEQPLGTPPDWVAVPGMVPFTDDALMVNTGTAPYTNGRIGFASWFGASQAQRRVYFDAITVDRQL